MKLYDEIHRFAREYISDKRLRSSGRKRKIKEAYERLTGEKIKISCSTCYIEALLIIINNTKMAARNYELKKGVVLQAFGQPQKTCTNDSLTDKLAEWYLKNYPEKIIFFSRVPNIYRNIPPANIEIVKPVVKAKKAKKSKDVIEIINPVKTKKPDIASEILASAMGDTLGEKPSLEQSYSFKAKKWILYDKTTGKVISSDGKKQPEVPVRKRKT